MGKITLTHVAEAANVSLMTVSRAIHGKPGVSDELRAELIALAEKMGYVPNRSVRELEMAGSALTVGVVIPHLANTIFPEMIQSIDTYLSANGYRILLCCSYNNTVKEFREISSLLERKIDGIIWSPVLYENTRHIGEMIFKQNCPLVFMDRIVKGIEADSVVVDDFNGMTALVEHLLDQGITKIAYLGARMESYVALERLRGYTETMHKHGIALRDEWIVPVGSDVSAGRSGAAHLLSLPDKPEAICCFNDPLALGVELELLERGIVIPDEMAITGFSGTLETELARIPITSTYQNAVELGNSAARLLFSRMVNPANHFPKVRKVIKTNLLIRESSNCKKR